MQLTLDRLDLKPEFQNTNCSQTTFGQFSEQAQVAIEAVGRAQFREFDGSNYNAIYPPLVKQEAGAYSNDPNNDQRDWQ